MNHKPILVAVLAVLLAFGGSAWGRDFFVARDGKEGNAGTKDSPFKTLVQARDAIRALKAASGGELKEPMRVILRTGTHFLPATFTLSAEDSGTAVCPVVYMASPGETVIVSGGRPITGWKDAEVNGVKCWSVVLPDVASGAWNFTQLFVGGQRYARTRLPETGFYRFAGVPEGETRELFKGPKAANFAPGEIKNWKNLADIALVIPQKWVEQHHRLNQVDEQANVVKFNDTCFNDLADELDSKILAPYYLENILEAMDKPGEWYLDRPTGTLYYIPKDGQEPESTDVVASGLACLVDIAGADDKKVEFVRFENLVFSHAEWRYPVETRGASQAAATVPGAIHMKNAANCVLYGCSIRAIGNYAVEVDAGASDNQIVACSMTDLGAGGVKMLKGSTHTTVTDSNIQNGGIIFHSAVGVLCMDSGRNRIRNNNIADLFYTGISCGWTWGYAPTNTVDNRIEYNHIHDLGKGLLSDMGGIYTLGTQPGTILRGNVIHDITKYAYGGWGIYTDEGSSEILIEGNLTYRTQCSGFHQHYGRDNWVRNNIFALGSEHQIQRSREENHRSFLFGDNIIYWKSGPLMTGGWKNDNYLFYRNLYWREDNPDGIEFAGALLEDWLTKGQDYGCLVMDPMFAAPTAGDFTLRGDSPAFRNGFKPVDASKAGPRFKGQRPATFEEWPADKETPAVIMQTRLELVASPEGDSKPGQVKMTVTNLGDADGQGSVILQVYPPAAGTITKQGQTEDPNMPADMDPAKLNTADKAAPKALEVKASAQIPCEFSLAPGASKTEVFDVTAWHPEIGKLAVETQPHGDGMIPTLLQFEVKNPEAATK